MLFCSELIMQQVYTLQSPLSSEKHVYQWVDRAHGQAGVPDDRIVILPRAINVMRGVFPGRTGEGLTESLSTLPVDGHGVV